LCGQLATSAHAESPDCDPRFKDRCCDLEYPERCSALLRAGSTGPFSGQLLTTELAISLAHRADSTDRRLEIAMQAVTSSVAAVRARDAAIAAADLRAANQRAAIWEAAAKREEARANAGAPWYAHPAFVVPVTVAITVGAILCGRALVVAAP
jgi:hypothetical protein